MVRLADFARRCAGLLLAAALTVGAPGPARAETAAPAQADVILLLDRSGSMLKNDPQGLTDSGAQVFVDMLDPQDRVAIVAFDSDARVLLPLSPVGDGSAARKALGAMGRPVGQWTDIQAALSAALGQLDLSPEYRAPAVLLFTDGKPETQPDGVPAGYAAELAQTVSRLAGRSVPVFTVGLGNADFATLGQIATGTRAEPFTAASPQQAAQIFSDILSRVKERRVTLSFTEDLAPGVAGPVHTFTVPPYTRLLTLSGVASGGVKLKGQVPGGGALEAAPGARVSSGANYTVLTVPNPTPGTWSVQLEGSGRAVAQAQTESALRLSLVQPQPYSQVGASTPLAVAVSGDPDPQSPLELWAQAGAGQAVKLTRSGDRYEGRVATGDGRLAVWATRAGGEVARREFRVYPMAGTGATASAELGRQKGRPWLLAGVITALTAALLLVAGAFNWRRIRRRDEQLAGRLGTHSLNGRGKVQIIGDLARLEARLVPRGWAPLAGLGLARRELQIYIHPTRDVRIQINGRPPGEGRLYHEDEVTLGGETMTYHNPRLPRRPKSDAARRAPFARPTGRPTLKG